MQFTMLVDGCRCNGTPIVGLPSTASSRFCCHKSYVNYLFLHDQGEVIDCFTFVVFFPLARGGTLDLSELLSPSPPAASDLNCELRISVGTAGPPPRAPDLSGHCTSRELQMSVGTDGPRPQAPDLSGHCWTLTASTRSQWALPDLMRELQISVGTAGPQPEARENAR